MVLSLCKMNISILENPQAKVSICNMNNKTSMSSLKEVVLGKLYPGGQIEYNVSVEYVCSLKKLQNWYVNLIKYILTPDLRGFFYLKDAENIFQEKSVVTQKYTQFL